jgi:alpha-mannosidase
MGVPSRLDRVSVVRRAPASYAPAVLPDHQMDAIRFEEFCNDLLRPLAMPRRAPLRVEVAHFDERVSPTIAQRAKRTRVEPGYRWGPIWSTAWFRVQGTMPRDFAGERVLLRFSSGTEACVWVDGVPHAGLDPYHDTAPIAPLVWNDRARGRAGQRVDLWIEAACNLPLGATTFWWDQPEVRARWSERKPGRLECAELVALDEGLWQFAERFDFLRRCLWNGSAEDPRTNDLRSGLGSIVRAIPAATISRSAVLAQAPALEALLKGSADPLHAITCVPIGHAHIDTAWLWRIDETRRKCVRTFATALRSIERFPGFTFLCSQAAQYRMVQEESPALFDQVRKAVKAGRWEPNGAMWIEPDGTCPSGESFIRQIVHGTGWWREQFGAAAPQRFLYLPDTFGFPACLPQIIALAGLDTFITNKMIWSGTNRFPHVTFRWRGLDGTEVLSHFTPGHNYNSEFLPNDLVAGARNIERQDRGRVRAYLQPYGWGDGGGGPDPSQIERAANARRSQGLPACEPMKAGDLCGELHRQARASERRGEPLPVWDGELYLEAHRGTYTSQRWIKRANRRGERLLRQVEMLAVIAPMPRAEERALLAELDGLWKTVLLHQFHDILPGSSIKAVYDDARIAMGAALKRLEALRDDGLARIRARVPAAGEVVFNPSSTAIELEPAGEAGSLEPRVQEIPECGVATVRRPKPARAKATRTTLTLGHDVAEFDAQGRVSWIERDGISCTARDGHGLNELALYEDRPRRWEAWDTDREHAEKPIPITGRPAITPIVRGGVPMLRIERALGRASRIVQTCSLRPGESYLRIHTRLDWREERTVLRALFPTALRSRTVRFGTQCGWIDRDAHDNTSWQAAQFEVPGHDWMLIHDGQDGVAILDDGIFGKSGKLGSMGLTLVKSPNFPDPTCDRGVHEFEYAILPVGQDASSVSVQAEWFNNPPITVSTGRAGAAAAGMHPVGILAFGDGLLEVSAMKPASDGSGDVVVRVVDHSGAPRQVLVSPSMPHDDVVRCDLFEAPIARSRLAPCTDRDGWWLGLRAFEIASLRIRRAGRR